MGGGGNWQHVSTLKMNHEFLITHQEMSSLVYRIIFLCIVILKFTYVYLLTILATTTSQQFSVKSISRAKRF